MQTGPSIEELESWVEAAKICRFDGLNITQKMICLPDQMFYKKSYVDHMRISRIITNDVTELVEWLRSNSNSIYYAVDLE